MSSELDLLRQRVSILEAENTKLKQIIEEIANLRIENTKLKQIIKQNRTTNDALPISIPPPINNHSDTYDTPSSEIYQPVHTESKSLEDKKIDNFLDQIEKERVSNIISEKNREKKLQHTISSEINSTTEVRSAISHEIISQ